MVNYCIVPGCNSMPKTPGLSFHKVPRDPVFANLWSRILCECATSILKKEEECERLTRLTESMKVCSIHFREDDFRVTATGIRALKMGAVPTRFVMPQCPEFQERKHQKNSIYKEGELQNSVGSSPGREKSSENAKLVENCIRTTTPRKRKSNEVMKSVARLVGAIPPQKENKLNKAVNVKSLKNSDDTATFQCKLQNSVGVSPDMEKSQKDMELVEKSSKAIIPRKKKANGVVESAAKPISAPPPQKKKKLKDAVESVKNSDATRAFQGDLEYPVCESPEMENSHDDAEWVKKPSRVTAPRKQKSTGFVESPVKPISPTPSQKKSKKSVGSVKDSDDISTFQENVNVPINIIPKRSARKTVLNRKYQENVEAPINITANRSSKKAVLPCKYQSSSGDSGLSDGYRDRANTKHVVIVKGSDIYAAVVEKDTENEIWKTKGVSRVENLESQRLLIRNIDMFFNIKNDLELQQLASDAQTSREEIKKRTHALHQLASDAQTSHNKEMKERTLALHQLPFDSQTSCNEVMKERTCASAEVFSDKTVKKVSADKVADVLVEVPQELLVCSDCTKKRKEVVNLVQCNISSDFTFFLCPTDGCMFPLREEKLHQYIFRNLEDGNLRQSHADEAPSFNEMVRMLSQSTMGM